MQRDGLEYEGEFVRGRFEGLGKLTISREGARECLGDRRKGVVIRGGFKGGKVAGVVTAVYADGRTYTGELSVSAAPQRLEPSLPFCTASDVNGLSLDLRVHAATAVLILVSLAAGDLVA